MLKNKFTLDTLLVLNGLDVCEHEDTYVSTGQPERNVHIGNLDKLTNNAHCSRLPAS